MRTATITTGILTALVLGFLIGWSVPRHAPTNSTEVAPPTPPESNTVQMPPGYGIGRLMQLERHGSQPDAPMNFDFLELKAMLEIELGLTCQITGDELFARDRVDVLKFRRRGGVIVESSYTTDAETWGADEPQDAFYRQFRMLRVCCGVMSVPATVGVRLINAALFEPAIDGHDAMAFYDKMINAWDMDGTIMFSINVRDDAT